MSLKINTITLILGFFAFNSVLAAENTLENLSQIYQQALANSPQYQAYFYTMESEKTKQNIALSPLFPNLTLSANIQQNYAQQGNISGTYRNYQTGIAISQVLFNYTTYQAYQASKQSALQAEETYALQKQKFIVNVAIAYFNVLKAKEQLAFSQANLEAVTSTLKESKLKLKVGMSTDVDVKAAEANYYDALAQVKIKENEVSTAYFALYQYTGVENHNLANLKTNLDFANPKPNNIAVWISTAEQHNAELNAQIYAENAAHINLSGSYGSFLPTVSLQAEYGVNNAKGNSQGLALGGVTAGNAKSGAIILQFQWNILNGGTDYASIKKAAFEYQKEQFNTLEQQRSIKQKIETDFYNVISTIKRIQSLKQSVVAADSAYQQYQVRFKVGNATITDVLDQLKTLYQSESQLAEAKYAYITNMLNLKLDAGILSPEDIDDFNHWLDA